MGDIVPQESTSLLQKENITPWYQHVTVEPVMFLYMMAYMVTTVIEQTFYVFRACTVNHGYSPEICYNISSYSQINKEVQVTVSLFHQWNGIAGHAVPLLLAFFLGRYSDRRGRKVVLLGGLLGKLYFSLMITVITVTQWPLESVIYAATFPSALTGADLAIFAGCFAYIADVSSVRDRTLRVAVLDAVYLSTMPTGVAIGNVMYTRVVDRSFTAMFAINAGLMTLATLHCALFLRWQTAPGQQGAREAGVANPLADFFHMDNIKQTLVTLTKRRADNRRLFLWLLLISMAFYTFQRDEKQVMYLYTSAVFRWDQSDFSHFRTYLSSMYVGVMVFGIPLFTRVLNWKDTVIVMLGAAAHMSGHFVYAHARSGAAMYAGATAAALGPCVAPLVRSMTSKLLPPEERGVAFAFLSVMENAVAMFAAVLYAQLYNAVLGTPHINAIFYLTMSTQAVVFIIAISMELMLKGRRLESHEDAQDVQEDSTTAGVTS